MFEKIERKYGLSLLKAKKWTIGTLIGLMAATIGYSSVIDNKVLAHIGYIGGLFFILVISGIGVYELLQNPSTENEVPKFAS